MRHSTGVFSKDCNIVEDRRNGKDTSGPRGLRVFEKATILGKL